MSDVLGRRLALRNGHAVIEFQPVGGRPIADWAPWFGEARNDELQMRAF
jgi:hypothetical protein